MILRKMNMNDFRQIANGKKLLLIEFYATWCNPCKMMDPIIEELENDVTDWARVIKIDIDKHNNMVNKYQIESVPTIILFKKGEPVWHVSGITDKQVLIQNVKKFVKKF